jgi:hypothetical protein
MMSLFFHMECIDDPDEGLNGENMRENEREAIDPAEDKKLPEVRDVSIEPVVCSDNVYEGCDCRNG